MKKICYNTFCSAGVAHPVERHLAKVEVASSSLVTRSRKKTFVVRQRSFVFCPANAMRLGANDYYTYAICINRKDWFI